MGQHESSKRNKLKRISMGLCRDCSQKAVPGYTKCQKHLEYYRAYCKKRLEQLKGLYDERRE